MINFDTETNFSLDNPKDYSSWISRVIASEDRLLGEINYLFCSDDYLYKINVEHLQHDTLTDIITFDYNVGDTIYSDIFISIDRVIDNAKDFNVTFEEELKRVIIHGVLHLCGYKDKTDKEDALMRLKENEKINMFHVEQL